MTDTLSATSTKYAAVSALHFWAVFYFAAETTVSPSSNSVMSPSIPG